MPPRVAATPILGWVFVALFPMVAGFPFAGITELMVDAGMGPIDTFGSIMMIMPYYTEGALTLFLYRKVTAQLSGFLRMFNEKLGLLITPGTIKFD